MNRQTQWDPETYRKFATERDRPGHDLLGRLFSIAGFSPRYAVDLGCGTGELTLALKDHWPAAWVEGLDSSAEMLAKAQSLGGGVTWSKGDIATWTPLPPPDLIFSNAALQWVPDHDRLFPRLAGMLAPGGVFAVQMPRNFLAPSHQALYRVAARAPWRDQLAGVIRRDPVAAPETYISWLREFFGPMTVWETDYYQFLTGERPVLDWMKGTALRPVLSSLPEDQQASFLMELQAELAVAYPKSPVGETIFPFKRLFLVARKG